MRHIHEGNFKVMKEMAERYQSKAFISITHCSKAQWAHLRACDNIEQYRVISGKKCHKDDLNDGIAEFKDWTPEDSMVGSVGLFIKGWSKVAFWIGAAVFIWIVLSLK